MPSNDMDPRAGSEQPLLRAIFETREALTRKIEEFRALLLSRESRSESEEVAPAPAAAVVVEAVEPPAPPVVESEARPRRNQAGVARTLVREPAATASEPAPRPGGTAPGTRPPEPEARSDDPRERLDALARLLDKRARQSSSPAGDGPGRTADP